MRSKLASLERREVGHVALENGHIQAVPVGDVRVLSQLPRRRVQQSDLRAGRGQDRGLLPTTRCEREDPPAVDRREPVGRDQA